MEEAIKYSGYIGHKLSELETTFDYSKDNRKIVDIKNYAGLPNPFFILNDGDILSICILKHKDNLKVMT